MNILRATKDYEHWLSERLHLDPDHLDKKHELMAGDPFSFLRSAFYRWAGLYPRLFPELQEAPRVLSVGDLHIENFGTWRDREGRIIWGINDFDEAQPLPYTNDLVRLATSAGMAIATNHLRLSLNEACRAILSGYQQSLALGGRPFVLEEDHTALRNIALNRLRDPVRFWENLDSQCSQVRRLPSSANRILQNSLPKDANLTNILRRLAGQGSLGRYRFVAFAQLASARIAREAKALAPSACNWAHNNKVDSKIFYKKILAQSIRCQDPYVDVKGEWVTRRLAPDCSRIDLSTLPKSRDESLLLFSMGWETANIHAGSKSRTQDVLTDLAARHHIWLGNAVEKMSEHIENDWHVWRKLVKHT